MVVSIPLRGVHEEFPSITRLDADAKRVAFLSVEDLDPSVGNADGSTEAFLFDLPNGPARQITSGPPGDFGNQIAELALTPDGSQVVFTTSANLDSSASTHAVRQVFLYDDSTKTVRQLTDRSTNEPTGGHRPTISADGGRIGYESDGIYVIDVPSGETSRVVDETGNPSVPLLSADGNTLAFAVAADLDPEVLNEDVSPEIFVIDLETRRIMQVTDTINFPFVPYDTRMDAAADAFLVTTSGQLNSVRLWPLAVRVVRRRPHNHPPVLTSPRVIVAQEGTVSTTRLTASDADGESSPFLVETFRGS